MNSPAMIMKGTSARELYILEMLNNSATIALKKVDKLLLNIQQTLILQCC